MRRFSDKFVVVLFALLILLSAPGWCDNQASVSNDVSDSSIVSNLAQTSIIFFKDNISGVDGMRCPMSPTCSAYSLEAFQKHGFFIGWVMTCDRLLRCGRDELRVSPRIFSGGQVRCLDPVKNNDFWWTKSTSQK